MRLGMVGKEFSILRGQKRTNPVFFVVALLVLAGCSTDGSALAPKPPLMEIASLPREPITEVEISHAPPLERTALNTSAGYASGCKIKHRFDKGDTLAYQWGNGMRNRLGFDVEGLSWNDYEVDKIKVQYSLRLQPIQHKRQKCLYPSNWQGVVGSGYNELFLREKDTVWQELRQYRSDVEDGWDDLFE